MGRHCETCRCPPFLRGTKTAPAVAMFRNGGCTIKTAAAITGVSYNAVLVRVRKQRIPQCKRCHLAIAPAEKRWVKLPCRMPFYGSETKRPQVYATRAEKAAYQEQWNEPHPGFSNDLIERWEG